MKYSILQLEAPRTIRPDNVKPIKELLYFHMIIDKVAEFDFTIPKARYDSMKLLDLVDKYGSMAKG